MRKKKEVNNGENTKQKEWHIVSWSKEEDDILREQIRVHGTDNWAIIASRFKDKKPRQCRRRWFTYLNSDFKKGGWSPEEDMLLCEAQKIFGNRWTEIAKVVSGRTDNAVKNRFNTLCKKRAKHEALAKENINSSYINLSNKRVIFTGGSESGTPLKKLRTYNVSNTSKSQEEGLAGVEDHLLSRPPTAILTENVGSSEFEFSSQAHVDRIKEAMIGESENNNFQGTFVKKDDPKVVALMQQAELLTSLAIKLHLDKTGQSLESARTTVLQDYLKQNEESELTAFRNPGADFIQLQKFRELVEDLWSSNEGTRPSWRESDVYEPSSASSEYSTGSTLLPNLSNDKVEECQTQIFLLNPKTGHVLDDQHCLAEETGMCPIASSNEVGNILTHNDIIKDDNEEALCEFDSPAHVTPLFRAVAATIPSPIFSESEKHFLMKTLGMESTSPSIPSQHKTCKRSLVNCL